MGFDPEVGGFNPQVGPTKRPGGAGKTPTLNQVWLAGAVLEPPSGQPDFNVMPMPGGNLRFPGYTDWGTGRNGAGVGWYQAKGAINLSEPPAYELVAEAWQNSGVGGLGCGAFEIYELNDPAWNGNFGSISGGTQWQAELIAASNDTSQTSAHTNTIYGKRLYNANALSPPIPNVGGIGGGFQAELDLWCNNLGTIASAQLLEVRNLTGYGSEELRCLAIQNGASAQWLTHWLNGATTPAAGDGPTWWTDVDSRFGRFLAAAGIGPYQVTSNPQGAYGWRLWGTDGVTFPLATPLLDVNNLRGLLNGNVIPETIVFDLDMTNAADQGTVIPAKPGYVFVPSRFTSKVVAVTGTATNNPTFELGPVGTPAGYLGVTAPQTSGQINNGVGNVIGTDVSGSATPLVSNTAIHATVVTAVTGSTALTIRIMLIGVWTPQ